MEETKILAVDAERSLFMLGELPFITHLYERARHELDDDENLSIDGIKEMLLAARDEYQAEFKSRARKITPKLLSIYFKYVRNLSLIESRMTPDFGTLITAAQQLAGDQFAIHLAEVAKKVPVHRSYSIPNHSIWNRSSQITRWRCGKNDLSVARTSGGLAN